MNRTKINYGDLNARAKENYNAAKLCALLADYGYTCMRLSDDWQYADLIAIGIEGDHLAIQLKARPGVFTKYVGKNLLMGFPIRGEWYLIDHDELCQRFEEAIPNFRNTKSWAEGHYRLPAPNKKIIAALQPYKL